MNALTERIFAGVAAAAALPFVLYGGLRLLERSAAVEWRGAWVGALFAVPVFLTVGVAASIVADWLAGRWTPEEAESPRLRSYMLRLALYAAAGFGVFAGLAYMLPEPPSFRSAANGAWKIGVPAGLLYYHILIAIRAATTNAHIRKFSPPVETERLLLEPCTKERYKAAAAEGYPMGNHVKTYMRSLRRHPKLLGWGVWLVRLKETGEVIGDAGFKGNPDLAGEVDIGYGFLEEHRGRGYATEAASALVAWAFEHGAGRVTAETLRTNAASIRVLRKNGFRLYREDEHYHWRIDAVDRVRRR